MTEFFRKLFIAFNLFIIRLSRGRLGSQLGTQQILLLHSLGRKSGKAYVTPVAYFFTNGFYFLVGSNWGKETQAGWYYNLKAHPHTTIEVKGRTIPVQAAEAEGSEYDGLWTFATQRHPPYLRYQQATRRRLPIIILRPSDR